MEVKGYIAVNSDASLLLFSSLRAEFSSNDPTVLVIGAGHSGLEIAARLKYIGVPTLIVDRKPRVGDNVRPCFNLNLSHEHF